MSRKHTLYVRTCSATFVSATIILSGCLLKKGVNPESRTADNSRNPSLHDHHDQPGGPLLSGYPWGIFSLQQTFSKRVTFANNDNELSLANKIFESLGVQSGHNVMVAFPLFLEHKGYKPFGDGQSNAQANFSQWKGEHPPFLAFFDRVSLKTIILVHSAVSAGSSWQFTYTDGTTGEFSLSLIASDFPKSLSSVYTRMAIPNLNQDKLQWTSLNKGKVLFFKPSGWQDGFAVKFQNPFVAVSELIKNTPLRYASFSSNGKSLSIPNPLKVSYNKNMRPLIELMENATPNGYLTFANDRVHSEYPDNKPGFIEKTVGGNWTFLSNPTLWEKSAQEAKTFKQLYSCFAGRSMYEESIKKAISGTSWHNVGDPGEYLLNTIDGETRSLVAAIGEDLTTGMLPAGSSLSFGLTHNGYSGFLDPGYAFISLRDQYHWHPVHTTEPVCIEVWTPFCKLTDTNGYGMNCLN